VVARTRPVPASRADRAGIVASSVCAVHCLVVSVLAGASSVTLVFGDPRIEVGLSATAILLAVAALVTAFRRHRRTVPALIGGLGVTSVATARFAHAIPEGAETVLAVAGGALLVTAHVLNIRECRRADDCCARPPLAEGG
jgi:MerC mercury resistance protein